MNLLEQTKNLCKLYHIIPARSKGQNFLIKEEVYDEMVAAADLKPDETVLEVGPGLGFLTAKLAARAGKVIAVELDDKLAEVLKTGLVAKKIHPVKSGDAGILPLAKLFDGVKNVEVINGDILKFSVCHSREGENKNFLSLRPSSRNPGVGNKNVCADNPWIPGQARDDKKTYKVVANLPYNITSIFLRKYLEAEIKPKLAVLMLQKEVAERITASPREIPTASRGAERISRGKPGKMSLLAVSVQFYAKPEIIKIVPKEFFWPRPEVDSAIIKITPHPNPLLGKEREEKEFFQLVKFGFSAKRKMLKNNLAAGFKIDQSQAENKIKQAGFNGKIRAQELSVADWLKLLTVFE